MILGNLKYLSIQQKEFSNICLGKYIIQFIHKVARVVGWPSSLRRQVKTIHKNFCVFDSHYGNFSTCFMLSIVQLMFISVAAITSKYCFLADCSHYICQLYVNNDSQKYSLLDVLEMVYMYQLYLTIRCHIYNWTTADTEPRLKPVNFTTKTFAVYIS